MENKNITLIFICDKKLIHYFEDYINTFHHIFNVEILLFTNKEYIIHYFQNLTKENNNIQNHIYIFLQHIFNEISHDEIILQRYKICLLNTEQLSRNNYVNQIQSYNPLIYRIDYSIANLSFIHNQFKKVYLPYQIHHNEIFNYTKDKEICMIYPYKSQRRLDIIAKLKSHGINVNIINGFLGNRDKELMKHKILLNIHYDEDYNIFEELRCTRCIYNKMIVISEKSLFDDIYLFKKHLITCDYNDFVEKVIEIINNYDFYYNHLFQSFDKYLNIYENDLKNSAHENIDFILHH